LCPWLLCCPVIHVFKAPPYLLLLLLLLPSLLLLLLPLWLLLLLLLQQQCRMLAAAPTRDVFSLAASASLFRCWSNTLLPSLPVCARCISHSAAGWWSDGTEWQGGTSCDMHCVLLLHAGFQRH
jgi:hypothetical protein